ncbi:uncharacterized protein LOC135170613 [Diachasmimorpha longicaudata]|uniref:uncharacterized protein LOC135170613 n=1 Tax=Diachasmimorpha longicaudata TaxID=58733 RepID=UPI0030B8DB42
MTGISPFISLGRQKEAVTNDIELKGCDSYLTCDYYFFSFISTDFMEISVKNHLQKELNVYGTTGLVEPIWNTDYHRQEGDVLSKFQLDISILTNSGERTRIFVKKEPENCTYPRNFVRAGICVQSIYIVAIEKNILTKPKAKLVAT